ncbi:MAG TPA: site-2 protease family protein [Candidatus Polarisedimenticolia bacterium]|nr:site-2 protease family protein [Candidatus Polarisedimenticolia bacterium]
MKIFRLFGIDIFIHYSWVFIFGLILWSFAWGFFPLLYPGLERSVYLAAGLIGTLLFFVSVLLHELSHSLVATRHGIEVHGITLFIFGGVSHLADESPSPGTEFKIAVAGPLTSLLLGGLLLVVAGFSASPWEDLWAGLAAHLGFINLALGIFNLLPAFPLDGGRVLRAILWRRSGDRLKATSIAAAWGRGLGWVLIGSGVVIAFAGSLLQGLWMTFIGLFLSEAAEQQRRRAVVGNLLTGLHVENLMTSHPVTIASHLSVEAAVQDYFLRHGFGGFPVVRQGDVVGVVSLAHLSRCPLPERPRTTVETIMTPLRPDQMALPDEDLAAAVGKMTGSGLSRLPVLARANGAKLIGLLTQHSVMRYLQIRELVSRESRAA